MIHFHVFLYPDFSKVKFFYLSRFKSLALDPLPHFSFKTQNPFKIGLPATGRKNLCEKPRSKPGVAFFDKNTALQVPRTPNSGVENPNPRTEFLFYIDLYVNQR
jgi:hypothetical protein